MRTAWSTTGSLVSDRIRPHPPPPKQQQQLQSKGSKGKALTPEPPKSKVVRICEARLDDAHKSNGHTKDPKGGCFCQARKHALSSYVKICRQCGLILCTLNPPYCACPYCASALLDERERETLVERLQAELGEQLAREEMARQRAVEEARVAAGEFPMLPSPGLQGSRASPVPGPPTTHTVLSLNSETKKVKVSSYSTPTVSRPASWGEDREEEGRVPGPPREVGYVKEPLDPRRPWKNVRAGNVVYIPLPGGATEDTSKPTRRRKGGERGAGEREG